MIKDSYTTDEISRTMIENGYADSTNMEILTQIYKMARYSDHEITKRDVDIAKNAVKS